MLWLALLLRLAAPASAVELLHPPSSVDVSTVTAQQRRRINEQVPPNGAPALTDTSLERSAVGAGYTLIPLPAFSYNRNEGAWEGALTPLFRANAHGEVEDIFAPLYLHNDLIGETFTFNYFGYRSKGTRQYHAILSHATKVERTVDFGYQDTALGAGGRYILSLQANAGKSAFNRFYGFGNRSSASNESNYAMGDANLKLGAGFHLARPAAVVFQERYRDVSIENGVVSTLPQTLDAFPTAPGINGAEIWGQGVTLSYDTRDNPLTPLRGLYAVTSAEYSRNFQSGNHDQWWRTTTEVRHYLPHAGDRAVFVSHAMVDALPIDSKGLVPQGVPFYERPTLGGETTLRGYGRGRFVSSFALLFNIEERVNLMKRSIMGNVIELSAAPFLDFGRVGKSFTSDHIIKRMQFNPGVGLRLLARPNIASRLDVAYGHDGTAVFVGLDYPF